MYVVKQKVKGLDYYYLRKSVREGKKVLSKNVAYLGKDKKEAEKKAKKIIEEIKKSSDSLNTVARHKEITKNLDQDKKPIEREKAVNNKNKEINVLTEEKDFLSFLNEAGLIWGPSPEIYGGLAGFYTYGPLGKLLKNNIENSVRKIFNSNGFKEIE